MHLPRLAEIAIASCAREDAGSGPPYEAAMISIFTDVAEILARLRSGGMERVHAFALCQDIMQIALNGLILAVPERDQPALKSAYETVGQAFARDLADLNERADQ